MTDQPATAELQTAVMCPECGSTAPEPHRCAVGSPRYAMDADLTLYWPWVRPCWEER